MHRHHQKSFSGRAKTKFVPETDIAPKHFSEWENGQTRVGRAGSHSIPSPIPTAGAHAGRGAERVTVTIQLQHTVTHVFIVNVRSEEHANVVCPRPNMAWWCSVLKRGTEHRVSRRRFESIVSQHFLKIVSVRIRSHLTKRWKCYL